jgi:hypothetical protein
VAGRRRRGGLEAVLCNGGAKRVWGEEKY